MSAVILLSPVRASRRCVARRAASVPAAHAPAAHEPRAPHVAPASPQPPPGPSVGSRFLTPGDLHVAASPCAITTIVGSCVAVCLSDREAGVGGMNHFVLPERLGREGETRYGPFAMRQLIDSVIAQGGRKGHLEAKVFGGASLVGVTASGAGRLGSQNVRLAYETLELEGIPVVARDVEGHRGRKIIFHTHDGTAWVRRL